jgi:hypothetical protein
MYKLIYYILGEKYEFEASAMEEILSASLDAFNKNAELREIQKNGKLFHTSCEIYGLINKRIY